MDTRRERERGRMSTQRGVRQEIDCFRKAERVMTHRSNPRMHARLVWFGARAETCPQRRERGVRYRTCILRTRNRKLFLKYPAGFSAHSLQRLPQYTPFDSRVLCRTGTVVFLCMQSMDTFSKKYHSSSSSTNAISLTPDPPNMAMAVWTALVSGEHRTTLGAGERPSIDCRALRTRACPLEDRL